MQNYQIITAAAVKLHENPLLRSDPPFHGKIYIN